MNLPQWCGDFPGKGFVEFGDDGVFLLDDFRDATVDVSGVRA